MGERKGHFAAVPVDAPRVVLVVVEEVDLLRGLDHRRVQVEHLQQSARASLADAHDEGARELLHRRVEVHLLWISEVHLLRILEVHLLRISEVHLLWRAVALAQLMQQQDPLELQRAQQDLPRVGGPQTAVQGAGGLQSVGGDTGRPRRA